MAFMDYDKIIVGLKTGGVICLAAALPFFPIQGSSPFLVILSLMRFFPLMMLLLIFCMIFISPAQEKRALFKENYGASLKKIKSHCYKSGNKELYLSLVNYLIPLIKIISKLESKNLYSESDKDFSTDYISDMLSTCAKNPELVPYLAMNLSNIKYLSAMMAIIKDKEAFCYETTKGNKIKEFYEEYTDKMEKIQKTNDRILNYKKSLRKIEAKKREIKTKERIDSY